MNTVTDTVAIGAGVSGLTAARLLQHAGERVVVLEARSRIGGRINSQTVVDQAGTRTTTDLGASWIHGITGSSVHALTQALGMRNIEFTTGSYQVSGRPIVYYGVDGQKLDSAATEAYVADVNECDAVLASVISKFPAGVSYADAVAKALAGFDWDDARVARAREYFLHRAEEQYGADASVLDAHGLDDDQVEGDEVIFPEGYGHLTGALAHGLDIRLDTVVSEIVWEPGGARVVTNNGDFSAKRAIVTVPIGVLRAGELTFTPELPAASRESISKLQMNAFEKIFLRFDKQFWDQDVYTIRRQGPAAKWWHSWYNVSAASNHPTLLTFAGGEAAQATRTLSDEQIVDSVMVALREIYGADVPDPVAATVTRWQDDPYSHGSYAYMELGATTGDHDAIATPIADTIYIAGEATWTDDPATVTAGLESGMRAAGQILGRDIVVDEVIASL